MSSLTPIPVKASELLLPKPGTMVHLSTGFAPAMLKGIKVFPENTFQFEFILDKGDGYADSEMVKAESKKLVKYFMASLTTPENDLWVNLSPYEKERIVPDSFGKTDMGRDLLAQDYLLKQITASLMYPEDETGKKFWKRVYEEAAKKFGSTNIPVNTFNKVWIVPAKAVVYENPKTQTAYVAESRLKVMMEEDYVALNKNSVGAGPCAGPTCLGRPQGAAPTDNKIGSQIIREVIIPQLEREVNSNKNFAQLRQVYSSLILATWYKKKIKDSILAKVYADRNKIAGIEYNNSVIASEAKQSLTIDKIASSLKNTSRNDTEIIYQRYLQAFKKGVYNYIKEEMVIDPQTKKQGIFPRKYFSGGFNLAMSSDKELEIKDIKGPADMALMAKIADKVGNALMSVGVAINWVGIPGVRTGAVQGRINLLNYKVMSENNYTEELYKLKKLRKSRAWSEEDEVSFLGTLSRIQNPQQDELEIIRSVLQEGSNSLDKVVLQTIARNSSIYNFSLRIQAIERLIQVDPQLGGQELENISRDRRFQDWVSYYTGENIDRLGQMPIVQAVTILEGLSRDKQFGRMAVKALMDRGDVDALEVLDKIAQGLDVGHELKDDIISFLWGKNDNVRIRELVRRVEQNAYKSEQYERIRREALTELAGINKQEAVYALERLAYAGIVEAIEELDAIAKSIGSTFAVQARQALKYLINNDKVDVHSRIQIIALESMDAPRIVNPIEAAGILERMTSGDYWNLPGDLILDELEKLGRRAIPALERIIRKRQVRWDFVKKAVVVLSRLNSLKAMDAVAFLAQDVDNLMGANEVTDLLTQMSNLNNMPVRTLGVLIDKGSNLAREILAKINTPQATELIERFALGDEKYNHDWALDILDQRKAVTSLERVAVKELSRDRRDWAEFLLLRINNSDSLNALKRVIQQVGPSSMRGTFFEELGKTNLPEAIDILLMLALVEDKFQSDHYLLQGPLGPKARAQLDGMNVIERIRILEGYIFDSGTGKWIKENAVEALVRLKDEPQAQNILGRILVNKTMDLDGKLRGEAIWAWAGDPGLKQSYYEQLIRSTGKNVLLVESLLHGIAQLSTPEAVVFLETYVFENGQTEEYTMAWYATKNIAGMSIREAQEALKRIAENKMVHDDLRLVAIKGWKGNLIKKIDYLVFIASEPGISNSSVESIEAYLKELATQSQHGISALKDVILNVNRTYPSQERDIAVKALLDNQVARLLGVNIKVARYVRSGGGVHRLDDANFRGIINKIAYQLNRERTSHPSERRLGEDQKTSLFDYLFQLDDLTQIKAIFDEFFKNDPEDYMLEISAVSGLLKHFSIDLIKDVIKMVIDDPKQSLEEITNHLREKLVGVENADFIMREANWILSNLFVLQDRITLVEPIVKAYKKAGRTSEELTEFLTLVDTAKSFVDLMNLAGDSGIDLMDIFNFKIESLRQEAREDMIADALRNSQNFGTEQIEQIFSLFEFQPEQSRIRVYFKLLFAQSTDNKVVLRVIEALRAGEPINLKNMIAPIRSFLMKYKGVLIENVAFNEFWLKVESLGGKEDLKQLRALYVGRNPARTKLSNDQDITKLFGDLDQQITHRPRQSTLPHVNFEPLIRMGVSHGSMEYLRGIFREINANKTMRDQLATIKNRLFEHIDSFSTIDYPGRAKAFDNILSALIKGQEINQSNIQELYNSILYYLEQYEKTMSAYLKATAGLFSGDINAEILATSKQVLEQMLVGRIDDVALEKFKEQMSKIVLESLMARFNVHLLPQDKKNILDGLNISEEKANEIMSEYIKDNPRARWRDHEGRSAFDLIDKYLSNITETEIYRNMYEALLMEAQGLFHEWKYQSRDYKETLDAIIDLETEKLTDQERKEFEGLLEKQAGATKYEKLKDVEGFEEIKNKIQRIRNWETALSRKLDDGTRAEFIDDFYHLLNIGNYPNSTACQSVAYPNNLNRGLIGYLVNGTNRAVSVISADGRVVPARRIVRLRILKDENGKKQPVIFVEESTQFGVNHLDQLYGLLEDLSKKSGLPLVSSAYRPAQRLESHGGVSIKSKVLLFPARSNFDYSDSYGGSLEHIPSQGVIETWEREFLLMTVVNDNLNAGLRASAAMLSGVIKESIGMGIIVRENVSQTGGIDFKPDKMNMDIKIDSRFRGNDSGSGRNDKGILFDIDPAMLKEFENAPGFEPVIKSIEPLQSLMGFMGIAV